MGQSRFINDFSRCDDELVSGKRSQAERHGKEVEEKEIGLFCELSVELTDSLIVAAKSNAKGSRRDFNKISRVQAMVTEEKKLVLHGKKLDTTKDELIDTSYLHQQYHSPRFWLTEEQPFETFDKLKFKKDRMRFIKEQILICYLGFGWEVAHHP